MIRNAIVLAGGLGTRLRSVSKNLPKPMVDVNGRPFLSYVLDSLDQSSIESVCLAIGFRGDIIQQYFGTKYKSLSLEYSLEKELLGTGGAIKKAMLQTAQDKSLVLNGDSLVDLDIDKFIAFHSSALHDASIAIKKIDNVGRYGEVTIDSECTIRGFVEKGSESCGYINAGSYCLNSKLFDQIESEVAFSLERDIFSIQNRLNLKAYKTDGYFIDIGTPEDYYKFCEQSVDV